MAVNDRDPTTGGARGVDVYPGVANPTAHSSNSNPMSANFVRHVHMGIFDSLLTSLKYR
jgi:hypothetical protein